MQFTLGIHGPSKKRGLARFYFRFGDDPVISGRYFHHLLNLRNVRGEGAARRYQRGAAGALSARWLRAPAHPDWISLSITPCRSHCLMILGKCQRDQSNFLANCVLSPLNAVHGTVSLPHLTITGARPARDGSLGPVCAVDGRQRETLGAPGGLCDASPRSGYLKWPPLWHTRCPSLPWPLRRHEARFIAESCSRPVL
ncbi:hypothetical protein NDU88_000821 [Pleurodeles waltl]|uniref:Uncharacterized protein n=1 Tax=Pleurodeles waltl TaxID=8319 RepID=A0AAV7MLY4_PLEWA|nr:hypothetical protein NDU88_000821 [Pleurodeles waltl]